MDPSSVKSTQWLPFGTVFSVAGDDRGRECFDTSFNVHAGAITFASAPSAVTCGKAIGASSCLNQKAQAEEECRPTNISKISSSGNFAWLPLLKFEQSIRDLEK